MPSETELAESLGVGKSSVREAIKMLEALGVVQICKGNGSRVRTCVHASMLNPLIFQLILNSNEERQAQLVEFRKMIEISEVCWRLTMLQKRILNNYGKYTNSLKQILNVEKQRYMI